MAIRWKSAAANAATVVVSIVLTLAAMEGALRLYAVFSDSAALAPAPKTAEGRWARAEARHWLLSMPEEWRFRTTTVPGAATAYAVKSAVSK